MIEVNLPGPGWVSEAGAFAIFLLAVCGVIGVFVFLAACAREEREKASRLKMLEDRSREIDMELLLIEELPELGVDMDDARVESRRDELDAERRGIEQDTFWMKH